uniref:Uncharacterized protein n=1 Tax=Anopheles atroparvus TaxID=41427 RepID=A0AAG5DLY8_ANOAO
MVKSSGVVALLAMALVHLACANLASDSTVSSGKLLSGPAPPPSPSTSLGGLYRSARDDYNARRHCSNCGPGYERDMRTYGRRGIVGYYSGMGSIEDDRNWYYRPEVFDDRVRGGGGGYQQSYAAAGYRQPGYMMGYEYDRYMHRPDDRGYGYGYPGMGMNPGGYYDTGSSRMSQYPEMMRGYGYRGNGYDNLDPQYEYYMTQRGSAGMSNRDRYYQPQGYYEDRMGYGGQYDQKNFRPWDQTYSGISGFDNSGRGYYFASRPSTSSSPSSPSSSPTSSSSSPSYSAHASYHVQAQPAPAPSGYGGHGGSSQGHEPANRPGQQGYRPEYQHHGGPDRPDYQPPSDAASSCCRNRYPEQASHHPAAPGNYPGHNPTGPNAASAYGDGAGAHNRPATSSGTWSYVSSGPTGVQHHGGSSTSAQASYGGHQSGGGPGQYPGGSGASGHESYGGNRGGAEQHRETDSRHQSAAYGGRPRPSAIGDTSYLMERGDDSNRVSSDPTPKPTDEDDSASRAKPDPVPKNAHNESEDPSAPGSDSNAHNIDRSA